MSLHLNLPRVVCDHLLGKDNHTPVHRMTVGAIVMVFGVGVSLAGAETHLFVLHYSGDIVGYALHGLGLVPFIERLAND